LHFLAEPALAVLSAKTWDAAAALRTVAERTSGDPVVGEERNGDNPKHNIRPDSAAQPRCHRPKFKHRGCAVEDDEAGMRGVQSHERGEAQRDRAAGLMDAPWPPVYPKQPDEPPRVAPSRARKDAS